jgi:signal transduction histidine kinase
MSLKTVNPAQRSAVWRISLLGTLVFALGTLVVSVSLHRIIAEDIEQRSDAWLSGEVEVLAAVAERTPKDALYGRILGEVAELVRSKIPNKNRSERLSNDSAFFLQIGEDGLLRLWVGAGDGREVFKAIRESQLPAGLPRDLPVNGLAIPYRVVSILVEDGSRIYLGFSERDQLRVLNVLLRRFIALWLLTVLLGFALVFVTTRRMLSHVQRITETASKIGRSDLNSRVPTTQRNDEVDRLALTLNSMLDRIESSMHQLHTITDSLAHDLRSPLTAIRGRFEMSLSAARSSEQIDSSVLAIEELDRLIDFLSVSLDVAEARADALRLRRTEFYLDELLKSMVDLYKPSMADNDLEVVFSCAHPVRISADDALIHRVIGNLFENELKHLPAACKIAIQLRTDNESAILELEDNGPGFAPDVCLRVFESRVKGTESNGHGLGLAFVDAVVHAHGGTVTAANREQGGARIVVTLPLASTTQRHSSILTDEGAQGSSLVMLTEPVGFGNRLA